MKYYNIDVLSKEDRILTWNLRDATVKEQRDLVLMDEQAASLHLFNELLDPTRTSIKSVTEDGEPVDLDTITQGELLSMLEARTAFFGLVKPAKPTTG